MLDPETKETLVRKDHFAFLIAVAFDRGMPWEKAWQIPTKIKIDQRGKLDPEELAEMGEDELEALLKRLPITPRYGEKQGAETLSDAARLVAQRFGGDAKAIWRDSSPCVVERTLQEIRGIGPGIASMATRILHQEFGCFSKEQEREIDVKPDVHLKRVFKRTGLSESDSEREVRLAARCLNPEFPGQLNRPAWWIGRNRCHPRPRTPDCDHCRLDEVCAKRF